MSCYGAREMEASVRTVRKNTVVIAAEIPEDQYGYRATPDVMSVAEMLAHIAMATRAQQDVHRVPHLTRQRPAMVAQQQPQA